MIESLQFSFLSRKHPFLAHLAAPLRLVCSTFLHHAGVSQQQLDELSAQLPRVQQRQTNGASSGPEGSLKWLDGEPVEQWQLRRLVGLPSVWTVHDLIWNQQV
jgi:hypothetical protein